MRVLRRRGRTSPRRVAGAAAAVLIVAGAATVVAARADVLPVPSSGDDGRPEVTVSSAAADVDAGALTDPDPDADGAEERRAAWRTGSEPVGSWVRLRWSEATTVDRVRVRATDEGLPPPTSALLTFDGGSSLLVTPDAEGNATVTFPPVEVADVRLTVASAPEGTEGVALASLVLDDSGADIEDGSASARAPVATSSSAAPGAPADSLADGAATPGAEGAEWRATPRDPEPWVQLSWDSPRMISAVQILGPSREAFDPASSGASPLGGRLEFSDGSTVVVSGIEGGDGPPTTLAVTPRMTTSVKLHLSKRIPNAEVALRELSVYDAGTTPPRWPVDDGYATTPEPARCDEREAGPEPVGGALTLLCPSPGSTVSGEAEVVVGAPPGTPLEVTAWQLLPGSASGQMARVAGATADEEGRAAVTFPTADLPKGPIAVRVSVDDGTGDDPADALYVQLVNLDGREVPGPTHAPPGMTLQWEEDFSAPLSVSGTGQGAVYAATKPEHWGRGEFGDAVFADPAWGADTVSTIPGGHLRLRAAPIGDLDVPTPYGQQHLGGILSSLRVGAGGFAAQYGYFEARMTGAPGTGTWPAFWMLNTQAATTDNATSGEVDAVELYGPRTTSSCHTTHAWGVTEGETEDAECLDVNGASDWAMTWHTYGVRITPDRATFTIDGIEVASKPGVARSDEPFFFLVNMALGGGWPVDLTPTGGTSDLYVDHVRVYS